MSVQGKLLIAVVVLILTVLDCQAQSAELDPKLNPSTAPGPTMKSLDQIAPTWDQVLPAAERFKVVMDGAAVLDRETGLVWEKILPAILGLFVFRDAYNGCRNKKLGNRMGWRLPTSTELLSLVDPNTNNLPAGHPFDVSSQSSLIFMAADPNPESPTTTWTRVYFTAPAAKTDYILTSHSPLAGGYWCVRGGQN